MPPRATDRQFTFALRAGDMLLRNGSPSANVTQAMLAIAASCGYPRATANVTMGQITLSYAADDDTSPVTRVQSVGVAGLDIHVLSVLEHIVEDVVRGDIDVAEGLARLDALEAEPAQRRPLELLGSALMGAGFAWLLGGNAAVCVVAALCAALVDSAVAVSARFELPAYYSRILAGALAVGATAALAAHVTVASPGVVIVAAVVTQLAGSSSVGAIQDVLTGWLLTAVGRLIESIILTLGLAVGVIVGVLGAGRLGVHLDVEETGDGATALWQRVAAAALITAGFALLSHARGRHLPVLVALGSLATLAYAGTEAFGLSTYASTTVAAAIVGLVTVVLARPTHLPTSGLLDIAIVPLVPGMALYQGFAALATQRSTGPSHLFEATGVALSIGTGAVLGQFIASRMLWSLRGAQHRLVARRRGIAALADSQVAARGVSTPDFRRPFVETEQDTPRA